MKLLVGPDGEDTGCIPWELGDPSTVKLEELQVFNISGNAAGVMPLSQDLKVGIRKIWID